ncbi:hypothetical protein PAP18089_01913 [Pandoraea apista]|uniref:Bacteriophage protein n=1 Tax=Pandoraea apista TaxID=93218 RepID=A0A5E5P2U8_9BURK|nr:hypothetical protein PAP18089_01913 [Pandoraea apista]
MRGFFIAMKASLIVAHLRAHCPIFARRVFAGIDWETLEGQGKLSMPAAYVIEMDDTAQANDLDTGIRQVVTDTFDVCVALAAPDERSGASVDLIDTVRAALLLALAGWKPEPQFDPVQYEGKQLVLTNRFRSVYRFTFSAEWQLGRNDPSDPAETWHEWYLDGLPELEGITINVDVIDPAFDKNLSHHGPDGRIEVTLKEEFKT